MSVELLNQCAVAVEHLSQVKPPSRIRVVSHYDADGISAAAVLCKALYHHGYDFHVSLMRNPFDKGFQRLEQENNDFVIFSDMGSGQLDLIERLGCPCIVLDHHQIKRKDTDEQVVQVNANLCGYDGNYEACGASISYAFAKQLHEKNVSLAGLAMVGATGDKQYIGGLRGWNKQVLDEAVDQGILKPMSGVKLAGKSLGEALHFSIDPYFKGLSGNEDEIQQLCSQINIDREIPPEELSSEQRKQLQSLLVLRLMKDKIPANIIDIVSRRRYVLADMNFELERFADLLDACGKFGHRGIGLALCMGNQKMLVEAVRVEQEYKTKVLDALQTIEKNGVDEREGFRFFHSDHSSLGGVIAGIAVNYLLDEEKPLISLARKDGELHVSCRGNQQLVHQGLDLGLAMSKAAESLDGYGGGHMIAAGATINGDAEEEFLDQVNKILVKQLEGSK